MNLTPVKMARRVEPEWLDGLPWRDPVAVRSRRDLRRVNLLMGNAAIIQRELNRHCGDESHRAIAEIGAGDGTLMLQLAQACTPRWSDSDVVLLDRQDLVSPTTLNAFSSFGWRAECVASDVFSWLAEPPGRVFDVMVANLFLHHFEAPALAALLSLIAGRTRLFVACEPRRSGLALLGSRLLGFVGCNRVVRHDAVVSVRAGFDAQELSAMWPRGGPWLLQEHAAGVFSHCFVARRLDGKSAA